MRAPSETPESPNSKLAAVRQHLQNILNLKTIIPATTLAILITIFSEYPCISLTPDSTEEVPLWNYFKHSIRQVLDPSEEGVPQEFPPLYWQDPNYEPPQAPESPQPEEESEQPDGDSPSHPSPSRPILDQDGVALA